MKTAFQNLSRGLGGRKLKAAMVCIAGVLLAGNTLILAREGRAFITPSARDKCPVCGMFVAKYPDWIAEVVFRDGSYQVFDGAKDLFSYLADVGRYTPGKRTAEIEAIYATDYYSVTPIDAHNAFYVIGSDIYGPMGAELVAFKNESDAREFMKDHGGKQLLRFTDITPSLIKTLF